ncbi:MAG: hypothetical protein AB7T49_08210 [Oligoflexales bacterium]
MLTEPLPLDVFVTTRFEDKTIIQIFENWNVEVTFLQKIVITHFKELGIFHIRPDLEDFAKDTIKFVLQWSPEIKAAVRKAEIEEEKRRQTRHQNP